MEQNTVQDFLSLSKKERRVAYDTLQPDVRAVVRPIIEANRGIIRQDGKIIRSKEWLKSEIARLEVVVATQTGAVAENTQVRIAGFTQMLADAPSQKEVDKRISEILN